MGLVSAVALAAGVLLGSGSADELADVVRPDAPPPIPEAFPGDGDRYLPDVSVSALVEELQTVAPESPAACEEWPQGAGTAKRAEQVEVCTFGGVANLEIAYDDQTRVRRAVVACPRDPPVDGGPAADCDEALIALAGAAVVGGGSGLREEARDWASQLTYDLPPQPKLTTLGSVRLFTPPPSAEFYAGGPLQHSAMVIVAVPAV